MADHLGESYFPLRTGGPPARTFPPRWRTIDPGSGARKCVSLPRVIRALSGWSATSIRISNPIGTCLSTLPTTIGAKCPTSAIGFTQYQPTKILQNSVFGELSYTIVSDLTATVGARRYSYHGHGQHRRVGLFQFLGRRITTITTRPSSATRASRRSSTSRIRWTPALLVYATVRRGLSARRRQPTDSHLGRRFVSGGARGDRLTSAPLGFKPDKVWSYELGEKFRGNESRLTINSAGYFENWQHIQQNIPSRAAFPTRATRALPTSTVPSSR